MKKGFNATTLVLVAILVSALFLVGRTVTPPPPGPPEPPKVAKAQSGDPMVAMKPGMSPADRAHKMQEMMRQRAKQGKNLAKGPVNKKFDPNQIEIAPGWTHNRIQGEVGNEVMAKQVAAAKAEQAKALASGHVPTTPESVKPAK